VQAGCFKAPFGKGGYYCRVLADTATGSKVSNRKELLALFYRYKVNFLCATNPEDPEKYRQIVRAAGVPAGLVPILKIAGLQSDGKLFLAAYAVLAGVIVYH